MSRRSEAVSRLYREELSCVIEKEGRTYTSDQFGIKPLMQFLRRDRRFFEGAAVADKVIGKAAALLLIDGGAAEVFGAVMSESAAKVLSEYGVSFGYCELVPMIENRTQMCIRDRVVAVRIVRPHKDKRPAGNRLNGIVYNMKRSAFGHQKEFIKIVTVQLIRFPHAVLPDHKPKIVLIRFML